VSFPKRNDPFAEFYGEFSDRLRGDRWQPDVDVYETPGEVVVRVEIAGVRSEDVRVTVDGDVLRISGVRAPRDAVDIERLHQMEIAAGPFERRVRIPVEFERERVTAHLADGFLTVSLAKKGRRTIDVRGG
jgi:HSP20 family protein